MLDYLIPLFGLLPKLAVVWMTAEKSFTKTYYVGARLWVFNEAD